MNILCQVLRIIAFFFIFLIKAAVHNGVKESKTEEININFNGINDPEQPKIDKADESSR
ncbi:hypothetical protein [Enterococcus mediterraneensis]|uniref:hypothetical protein n=1 Tax=Enterococcus mediterraneensis TaxID=2364791 RepID=UPI0013DE9F43|nr:hypothetical protein [Enterococcus mediterraneensis]